MTRDQLLSRPLFPGELRYAVKGDTKPGNVFFSEDGDPYLCVDVRGTARLMALGDRYEVSDPFDHGLELQTAGKLVVELLPTAVSGFRGSLYGSAIVTLTGIAIVGRDLASNGHAPAIISLDGCVQIADSASKTCVVYKGWRLSWSRGDEVIMLHERSAVPVKP